MTAPSIRSSVRVVPMVYAYTTPGVEYHDGWTKIGYTERDVETRVREQTHTAGIRYVIEWKGNAVFDDGSGVRFSDKDFHSYLRKRGVKQEEGEDNEWFNITGKESKVEFNDFRANHGILLRDKAVIPYRLRDEQEEAVKRAEEFRATHAGGEFLWNCKPRFGKTLAVYDLAKKIGANTVLVVTNRPAIANSWLNDYNTFMGPESGYLFVSEAEAIARKDGVLSRKEFVGLPAERSGKCIEFVSLQDLKGSIYFGGDYDKLREVRDIEWDLLVVDEAHEGVDTQKTDTAFEQIRRKFTLHLSGTPFKAIARGKFSSEAIFNWTYADEQAKKAEWKISNIENPYSELPRLSLYTYKMSDIVKDELRRGIDIDGDRESFAFDLNEFFATNGNGAFVHDAEVDKFLDALTSQKKFPFSTQELRNELKHTFWILNRVDSAKALARKLKEHPVFKDYEIVLAAGDGKLDGDYDAEEEKKSLDKVLKAIDKYERTITLSVGQLTTGVTVREWTAVMMLCSMASPSQYMQAAFRAQNPCLFDECGEFKRKTDAYVFDFDPARTLIIFEQFANDLCSRTADGRGDTDERKRNVRELLNFFPVIGEDEEGELVELDAEKVLTLPRRIKSAEVVNSGFMSNFLFQNIAQVFAAPHEVMSIIDKFQSVGKDEALAQDAKGAKDRLSLDDEGKVAIADEEINGKVSELFGEKIYDVREVVDGATGDGLFVGDDKDVSDTLKETIRETIVKDIVSAAKEVYGDKMKPSDERRIEAKLSDDAEKKINAVVANTEIERKVIEQERTEALQTRFETGRSAQEINAEFDALQVKRSEEHKEKLAAAIEEIVRTSERETVRIVETKVKERERDGLMDKVRDHLRGFARTIPSFLMAYGDETTSLESFDRIIPDDVFREVTGISLEEFRFLRDGGEYDDEATGQKKRFAGNLFDGIVFDDSVKEFMAKRRKLANYFDESAEEDIFDYIPPQRNNQIFTPRKVVKRMVDLLEKENPGCFDDSTKTFADLYMKSGMFITEIVKRLYLSAVLKKKFPDSRKRLRHIFERQVFGLAPTEIIYRIAVNYIMGFDSSEEKLRHNFKRLDALALAKAGQLKVGVDKVWGDW